MGDGVRFVEANGLRFGYLESGQGPLVLLVHGFPDTAYSWDATRPALAAAGFRAVGLFTRGYAPTDVPKEEAYDSDTLGRDLIALIRTLGGEPAIVVGHDWGAPARSLPVDVVDRERAVDGGDLRRLPRAARACRPGLVGLPLPHLDALLALPHQHDRAERRDLPVVL